MQAGITEQPVVFIYLFGTTNSGGWTQEGPCHTLEWWNCKKYSLKMPCSPKINEATNWLLLLSCSYPNLWCTHNPHGGKTTEEKKEKFFHSPPYNLKKSRKSGTLNSGWVCYFCSHLCVFAKPFFFCVAVKWASQQWNSALMCPALCFQSSICSTDPWRNEL